MIARAVDPGDRAEWRRMRGALWPEASAAEHAAETDAFFRGEGPLAAVFVCPRPAGGLAGFLELSVRSHAEGCRPGPVPYVEGWYVDPDARGRGSGRALIAAAERWARERGYTELASDARVDNEASHRAHLALGFDEVERAVHFRKAL
jgi:aminoglycoside 6'-N-acetyltransferase I